MHEIEPLHTSVDKLVQVGRGHVVLENPKGYPRHDSNLYLVAANGEILWKAEKPEPNTLFSRIALNEEGESLSTYTIGGHACEIDLKTGKLLSQSKIQ